MVSQKHRMVELKLSGMVGQLKKTTTTLFLGNLFGQYYFLASPSEVLGERRDDLQIVSTQWEQDGARL